MSLRHPLGTIFAAIVGLTLFASLEASAQQKGAVTFQAVDSLKARDLAILGRHGDFRSKAGPSITYWEFDSGPGREKKDGKTCIGFVLAKLTSPPGDAVVVAKVWAADGITALDRLSMTLSKAGDATLIFGTSADYKSCTDAAPDVTAACVARLSYVKVGATGEVSSSNGKLGAIKP